MRAAYEVADVLQHVGNSIETIGSAITVAVTGTVLNAKGISGKSGYKNAQLIYCLCLIFMWYSHYPIP